MNGKIIDYQIFYKPSEFLLMSQVKEALKDGWEPYGLPFFDGNGDVAQAMVKRGLSIESSIRQSLLAEIAERVVGADEEYYVNEYWNSGEQVTSPTYLEDPRNKERAVRNSLRASQRKLLKDLAKDV